MSFDGILDLTADVFNTKLQIMQYLYSSKTCWMHLGSFCTIRDCEQANFRWDVSRSWDIDGVYLKRVLAAKIWQPDSSVTMMTTATLKIVVRQHIALERDTQV